MRDTLASMNPIASRRTAFKFKCLQAKAEKAACVATLILATVGLNSAGATIQIPNASFESPTTAFVDLRVDGWQKNPKPIWFDESGGNLWEQLIGIFINPAEGSAGHIENSDGSQALYVFAIPQNGLFQDYDSKDWAHAEPTHAFDVKYEVGKSYSLAVGLKGGGGGMVEGAGIQLALYWRNEAGDRKIVASTMVFHSASQFPTSTRFVDFTASTPTLEAGNPAIGKQLGILIEALVLPEQAGGYWDLDNVRLTAEGEAGVELRHARVDGGLELKWTSQTGMEYQLRSSTDLMAWLPEGGRLLGTGGDLTRAVVVEPSGNRFFSLEISPVQQ